jgi:hypothetical protein
LETSPKKVDQLLVVPKQELQELQEPLGLLLLLGLLLPLEPQLLPVLLEPVRLPCP